MKLVKTLFASVVLYSSMIVLVAAYALGLALWKIGEAACKKLERQQNGRHHHA